MSAKVDQTSVVEPAGTKVSMGTATLSGSSPVGPKVSMFASKAGFVIPKNKLSGSLVPVFKGGKNPRGNDAVKEESTNQVQRKTKWGPDLSQDSTIRRTRALAYQTRVDQISEQLKSGSLETEGIQASPAANEHTAFERSSPQFEYKKSDLELEKREAIYEILKLDPTYKAPPDYKPLEKEATVPIPIKEYPGFNFLSLISGPGGENLNRLEKETGAKIRLYGTKASTGEKVEISPSNGSDVQVACEELTVHLTAESYEKVDAAVSVIELLVTSILGNFASGDKEKFSQSQNASTSVVPAAVNQQSVPIVGATLTPQQGQFQYQNTWFRSVTPEAPVHRPIFNQNYLAPNNLLHVQSSSLNPSTIPSAFGPRPDSASGFNLFRPETPYLPRNFPMPASQFSSAQGNIVSTHPLPGSQAQPTGSPPISRPVVSLLPQPVPTAVQGPQPTGWSGAPLGGPTSLGPVNMRQNLTVFSQPGFPSSATLSNMSAPYAVSPATIGSRPGGLQSINVPVNPTAGPISASFPYAQGGPFSTSRPIPPSSQVMDVPPSTNLSMHPVLGSAPQPNLHSGVAANFASTRPNTLIAPKLMHSGPGDFTVHPHHSENPASHALPRISNLHGAPTPLPNSMVPLSSSFRSTMHNSTPQLGMHTFPRPHERVQSQTHMSAAAPLGGNHTGISIPPRSSLPNPSLVSPSTPGMQMGLRNFNPVPHLPNMAGPFPSRPGNSLPLQPTYPTTAPRGNFLPTGHNFGKIPSFTSGGAASHQGGQQIYDPFSPTSISTRPQQPAKARKTENDPEYEDLMASVGVK